MYEQKIDNPNYIAIARSPPSLKFYMCICYELICIFNNFVVPLFFKTLLVISLISIIWITTYLTNDNTVTWKGADSKYYPLIDIYYNTNGTNSDRSVFVVPRRAYFDRRLVAGKPRNKVLIICEIHDDALKSIIGCELDDILSDSMYLIYETSFTHWVRTNMQGYTHRIAVVECPYSPELVSNGSITKIIYKKRDERFYSRVETEKPLLLTKLDTNPSKATQGPGSVIACTTVYNQPEWIDGWLRYQKTIGMDAVHINADITFYNDVNFSITHPFLDESLHNGFVQIDYWNDIVGKRMYNRGQLLKYQNCLYRYMGVFDFGMFADIDDYFTPTDPHHNDIHYYFDKLFSDKKIASVYFAWKEIKRCEPLEDLYKTLLNDTLISVLNQQKSAWRLETKCAHRLSGAMFLHIHSVFELLPGYSSKMAHRNFCYVSHHRIRKIPC